MGVGRGLGEIQPFWLLGPSPSKTAHTTRWLQMLPRGLSATQPVAVAGLERPPPQGRLFSGQEARLSVLGAVHWNAQLLLMDSFQVSTEAQKG